MAACTRTVPSPAELVKVCIKIRAPWEAEAYPTVSLLV